MFWIRLKYHKFMGNMWCFLAKNTLHLNRREDYIKNAKKHALALDILRKEVEEELIELRKTK